MRSFIRRPNCFTSDGGSGGSVSRRYDLQRFVKAQQSTYESALAELRSGRKTGHWMWFVFPQIAGLGQSPTSILYALASLDEARAYLAHPILGERLRGCARLALAVDGRSARQIFGPIDDTKFRSSMTLFMKAAPDEPLFAECLRKFFGGEADPATLEKL